MSSGKSGSPYARGADYAERGRGSPPPADRARAGPEQEPDGGNVGARGGPSGGPFCPFRRTARMVPRETPSARAIPRWLMLSARAPPMPSRFSSESFRVRPSGVKVLPHALHRKRRVPERFRPNGTTDPMSWQAGQARATISLTNHSTVATGCRYEDSWQTCASRVANCSHSVQRSCRHRYPLSGGCR